MAQHWWDLLSEGERMIAHRAVATSPRHWGCGMGIIAFLRPMEIILHLHGYRPVDRVERDRAWDLAEKLNEYLRLKHLNQLP